MIAKTKLDLTVDRILCHTPIVVIMILTIVRTILISRQPLRMISILAAVVLALSACSPGEDGAPEGVSVMATTSIWGDMVAHLVGDDGIVEFMIPVGGDAHDYQPSAGQVAALNEADLVIVNGLGLEEGLQDVLDAARADGVDVYEVAPDLDPLPFPERDGVDGDHEHADFDPHVWFDPTRVAVAARAIADRLAVIEPDVDWQARAMAYAAELEEVDSQIAALVESIPPDARKMVTNHEALGYFAARYGFEIIGVVIPGGSTLGEPSSAELAALVAEIERHGVKAVFADTSNPTALAYAVAAESGNQVVVVELHTSSLGDAGSGADTLTGMLLTNARLIVDALS
jgi:zinc/manganese transport system substrate-binding protein